MKWRTELQITSNSKKIDYTDSIYFIGSCFSENIGSRMKRLKFSTVLNPFGTLYNPESIWLNIRKSIDKHKASVDELVLDSGVFHHFDVHSTLSHVNPEECIAQINDARSATLEALRKSNWVIITLGSSFVFRRKKDQKIVANCHKMPSGLFDRSLLSPNEIGTILDDMTNAIIHVNPSVSIVFTISPVRHLSDGLNDNQLSKSALLVKVREICEKKECCLYFPSYEIMNDDLRDYRFYEQDMVHPNKQAIDYIWSKFQEQFFLKATVAQTEMIEKIIRGTEHEPFFPDTEAHKSFLRSTKEKCIKLQNSIPGLDFTKEIAELDKSVLR